MKAVMKEFYCNQQIIAKFLHEYWYMELIVLFIKMPVEM